ncbi:MAG: hypothetical protein ACTSVU_08890 [Promethearchaeota archaeon]
MSQQQILIEFTANFPGLFTNMQKYLRFINFHLGSSTQNKFYMETIENGLLYIYNDLDTFHSMNLSYTREEIYQFKSKNKLKFNPRLLTEGILDENNFPTEGINFKFKIFVDSPNIKKSIANDIYTHFSSFLGKLVIKRDRKQPEFDLVMNMKTFEAISIYNLLVAEMYSGLLKDTP